MKLSLLTLALGALSLVATAQDPDINVEVTSVSATLVPGDSEDFLIVIENTGSSDLEWSIDFTNLFTSGESTTFTKDNFAVFTAAANQDRISEDVWIARRDNQSLFNAKFEDGSDNSVSPLGTEWAIGGANVALANQYDAFVAHHGGNPGSLVGQVTALHLLESDRYFDVEFLSYTGGNSGGGFSYTRTEMHKWMDVSQLSGTTSAGGSSELVITLDASSLFSKSLTGTVTLNTNDPDESVVVISTSLEVSDPPVMAPSNTQFEVTVDAGQVTTQTLTISNNGAAPLDWLLLERVEFNKPNYADYTLVENQDRISENVWLTRQSQQGIYNYALESSYDRNSSPTGTSWALGSTEEAQSQGVPYTNFNGHYRSLFNSYQLPGKTSSLYVEEEDKYYDIFWTSYGRRGEGAGFGYVRSEPGIPSWVDVDIQSGLLEVGASETVVLTFDVTSLIQGTYEGTLKLRSNDPINPVIEIALTLQVNGDGMIDAPTSIDFGDVLIGNVAVGEFEVNNVGTDVLEVSALSFSDAQFSTTSSPFSLEPGQEKTVKVRYTPDTEGVNDATLTLTTNDPDNASYEIALSGNGVLPPAISISSFNLTETLVGGNVSTQTLTFENTGASELQVQISNEGAYLVDENGLATGGTVFFEKVDYGVEEDFITPNVVLTRETSGVLYNSALEDGYSRDSSPEGTLWAAGTTENPTSEYSNFRELRESLGSLSDLPGEQVSLFLLEEEVYLDFEFLSWTSSGNGGGFSYSRSSLNSWYSLSENTLAIAPGESATVDVTFSSLATLAGNYTGQLVVETNVPNDPELIVNMELTVSSDPPSAVSISETQIIETLATGATNTASFVIENTGSVDLDWQVDLENLDEIFKKGGSMVFEKVDYADESQEINQDRISETVWLTRGESQGLFNYFENESYDNGSPVGTEWRLGGTMDLDSEYTYTNWRNHARNYFDLDMLPGHTSSLHLIDEDLYFDIQWMSWTSSGDGGGFGYKRTEIIKVPWVQLDSEQDGTLAPGESTTVTLTLDATMLGNSVLNGDIVVTTSNPLQSSFTIPVELTVTGELVVMDEILLDQSSIEVSGQTGDFFEQSVEISNTGDEDVNFTLAYYGQSIAFSKSDNADWTLEENQDRISSDIWLTRATREGLFNIAINEEQDSDSPVGTQWALGSSFYSDLEYDFFRDALDSDIGRVLVPGTKMSMFTWDDQYFDFEFHHWTRGGGGGVSYTRREIPNWIDGEFSYNFTIPAGGSETLFFYLGDESLPGGVYNGIVELCTSSSVNPMIEIPVEMELIGTPDITSTSNVINLGDGYIGNDNTLTFEISNIGDGELIVTDIASDNAALTIPETSFVVPALGFPGATNTAEVEVIFSPTNVEAYSGTLTITSNDPIQSSYEVSWTADGIGLPGIEVTPASISVDVTGSETIFETVTISNAGSSTLFWQPEVVSPNGTVTFSKADYADWTLPENQDRITDNVWITRADERGIFNIAIEDEFVRDYDLGDGSPLGTEWAIGSVENNEGYDSWLEAVDGDAGDEILKNTYAMKLTNENAYFDVEFHSWTEQAQGGGFSYTRKRAVTWIEPSGEPSFEIAAGESVTIDLGFSGEGLATGSYLADVIIHTNIPDADPVVLSTTMNVTAQPELDQVSNVDLGDVYVTGNVLETITLRNDGYLPVEISSITSSSAEFAIYSTVSDIAPFSERTFDILFSPVAEGAVTATITVESNDPDGAMTFDITGNGISGPTFDFVPNEVFTATAITGGVRTKTYTIENNGSLDLSWSSDRKVIPGSLVYFEKKYSADVNLEENQDRITADVWITRGNNRGIFNIAAETGFNYGSSPSGTLWKLGSSTETIGTAGFTNWREHFRSQFSTPDLVGRTSTMYITNTDSYYNIEWMNWKSGGSSAPISFAYIRSQAAFWLDVSVDNGTIPAGESQEITVILSAEDLDGGNYLGEVIFESNLEEVSTHSIETNFTVTGTPEISVDSDNLDFGDVITGETETLVVSIANTGDDDLEISDLSIDDGAFSISETTLSIAPEESYDLEVTFLPTDAISYNGTLTIVHNDPLNTADVQVTLNGLGVGPPVIVVDQNELSAEFFYGQSSSSTFTIQNTGDSPLYWEFGAAGETVTFVKADGADWTLPENQDRITDGVWITRKEEKGIFNIASETGYVGNGGRDRVADSDPFFQGSPRGTLWAAGSSLSVDTEYTEWSEHVSFDIDDLPGTTSSMFLYHENLYFDIEWLNWTCCNDGGGFGYTRTPAFGPLPWAEFSANSGMIAAGASQTITVTFNPNGDSEGSYSADFLILSNDNVTASPALSVSLVVNGILGDADDILVQEGFGSTTVDLDGIFTDAQGDALTYTAASSNGGVATASVSGGTLTLTETGTGTSTISLVATDGKGSIAESSFEFTVNAVPTVTAPIADQTLTFGFSPEVLDISGVFTDADNDPLTYSASSSNEGIVTVSLVDDDLTLTDGGGTGTSTITLSAEDGIGGSGSDTFEVSVVILGIDDDLAGMIIYPNPTNKENIHVRLEGNYQGKVEMSIIDLSGNMVMKHNLSKSDRELAEDVSVGNLAPGNYILSLKTKDGSVVKRFVKQ